MIRHAILALATLVGGLAAAEPATAPAARAYPLGTCIVSDEALGSMGEAVSLVHDGQEYRFCCRGCIKTFRKDPAKFQAKLAAAAAKPGG